MKERKRPVVHETRRGKFVLRASTKKVGCLGQVKSTFNFTLDPRKH